MGTNERGGSPGFVRLLKNDAGGVILVYPEYSGNRLYQTLGNLKTDPRAGLCFPDLENGDILYLTCTTEIAIGKTAAAILPRSNVVVIAKIIKARFVSQGLGFRGRPGEPSPYNPPVRYLASERRQANAQAQTDKFIYAKLVRKDILTPHIARLRFSITDPEAAGRWNPGQYVALAFEDELSQGYSHVRELHSRLSRVFLDLPFTFGMAHKTYHSRRQALEPNASKSRRLTDFEIDAR